MSNPIFSRARTALAATLVIAATVALPLPASAATITVTTTLDVVDPLDGVTSLREAFDMANATPGDDEIVLGAGTYSITIGPAGNNTNSRGDLDHTDAAGNLTISGAGEGSTVVTTTLADRVIHMVRGHLTLTGLTISGGNGPTGAGVYGQRAGVTATDVTFSANTTTGSRNGGAVFANGDISATRVTLTNNEARQGGAFYVNSFAIDLVEVTATGNHARLYGGVFRARGPVTATDTTFTSNSAASRGGVGYVIGPASATTLFSDVTAISNSAGSQDGGVLYATRAVNVLGGLYSQNVAGRHGGAFVGGDSTAFTITGATFDQNTAGSNAGAVRVAREPSTISDSTFTSNTAGRDGGALWTNDSLSISSSSFAANEAARDGGAVFANRLTTSVDTSTFDSNTASRHGGSIYATSGLDMANSTAFGSTAGQRGGGLGASDLTLTHATVVGNTSTGGAGQVWASDLTVTGSVIALAGGGGDCVIGNPTTSGGGNFDGDGSCGLSGAGDISAGGDPVLGALSDNGGSTETMKPQSGSPVIGIAPLTLASDQRGEPRPAAPTDAGAVEVVDPVALDDDVTTDEDTPIVIDVIANDTDPDNLIDPSDVSAMSAPSDGNVVDNGDGTITYTPDPDWSGADSFTYANGYSGATVTVTVDPVNDDPVAGDDADTIDEDTVSTIDVLANDTDVDGPGLTVSAIVSSPANGTTVINPDNTIAYTPDPNWFGSDSYEYEASDGAGGTDTATVTITVDPVNDDPSVIDGTSLDFFIDEDTTLVIDETTVFEDVDGDPITVIAVGAASNGTTSVGSIIYQPNPDYTGADSFTATIIDGVGGELVANINVTIGPVDDPPVVVDETFFALAGETVGIDVLANDHDPDGDPLTLSIISVSHGTATVVDNTVRFTSDADFTGSVEVVYGVTASGVTVQGTLTVIVQEGLPLTGAEPGALALFAVMLLAAGATLVRRAAAAAKRS